QVDAAGRRDRGGRAQADVVVDRRSGQVRGEFRARAQRHDAARGVVGDEGAAGVGRGRAADGEGQDADLGGAGADGGAAADQVGGRDVAEPQVGVTGPRRGPEVIAAEQEGAAVDAGQAGGRVGEVQDRAGRAGGHRDGVV